MDEAKEVEISKYLDLMKRYQELLGKYLDLGETCQILRMELFELKHKEAIWKEKK